MRPSQNFKDHPLGPEELQETRLTNERMRLLWPIIGPIIAVVSNIRMVAAIILLIFWLNNPKLYALFLALVEGK